MLNELIYQVVGMVIKVPINTIFFQTHSIAFH